MTLLDFKEKLTPSSSSHFITIKLNNYN